MMFDGTIVGEYISLDENKSIEMKWRFKDWSEFAHCKITFEGVSSTEVTVKITNIPEKDKFGTTIDPNGI